ncbi:MAG: hypothetical protein WCE64_00290 [Bacteroidales bacterium]
MENISFFENTDSSDRFTQNSFGGRPIATATPGNRLSLENILSEGGEDFYQYLNWIGLAKEPGIMILSSKYHYYYDHNDLKEVGILVNLKRLNYIKHLESFLHTLFRILPSKANFVGCFLRQSSRNRTLPQHSKFINGFFGIFDIRSVRNLSKKGVNRLLDDHGFRLLDMTDINGVTYFWAQNRREPGR